MAGTSGCTKPSKPRRARRRGFEGFVHPLVPAILLRMRGLDQFGADAESHPPHGERRQSAQRIGGKRLAVIGADPLREAVAAKQALKDGPTAFGGGSEQTPAAEQEARRAILDREWIAVHAIAGAELAFEIRGPDRVRLLHRRAWRARMHPPRAATSRPHAAMALENPMDRCLRRYLVGGHPGLE